MSEDKNMEDDSLIGRLDGRAQFFDEQPLEASRSNLQKSADLFREAAREIERLNVSHAEQRRQAARECRDRINALIVKGPLPGDGLDKSAERNGLVLATNVIFDLAYWAPDNTAGGL